MLRKIIVSTFIISTSFLSVTSVSAEDSCISDYQGAPINTCPAEEPDPTNCYTGDYQGAPIEICLPTGEQLPDGSTINDEPVVYHESVTYVPVVDAVKVNVVPAKTTSVSASGLDPYVAERLASAIYAALAGLVRF